MIIEKEITINKNIDNAWKVLGIEFADAHKWASAINHSEGSGGEFQGASCSERGCSTTMGGLKEKLTKFSNEDYSLSYQVYDGMPSMVKYAENNWKLTSLGTNKSKLQMRMDLKVGGIMGTIMQPMMKMQMTKMGSQLLEEFKFYVENGTPHPRKQKTLRKSA